MAEKARLKRSAAAVAAAAAGIQASGQVLESPEAGVSASTSTSGAEMPSTSGTDAANASEQPAFAASSKDLPQSSTPGNASDDEVEDKMPNFWNLDNPIVATFSALAGIVLLNVILHGQ